MSGKDPSAGDAPEIVTVIFLSLAAGKTLPPAIVEAHAAHLAELDRKGSLVLAGPLLNHFSGLIVLQTASLAEARAIADEDPMIRGGFQTYELGTWIMANRQNHYRPNVQAALKQ
jgi:uncharacterized protein YciI